jgi:hypothetical protein
MRHFGEKRVVQLGCVQLKFVIEMQGARPLYATTYSEIGNSVIVSLRHINTYERYCRLKHLLCASNVKTR